MLKSLIAKIHVAKKELGLDDDTYRETLRQVTGKSSCSKLSEKQMIAVLEYFKQKGWPSNQDKEFRPVESPQIKKIYALWGDLQQSGIIRNKDKGALDQFVRRQVGVARADKLQDDDANKVIEILKQWIRRVENA